MSAEEVRHCVRCRARLRLGNESPYCSPCQTQINREGSLVLISGPPKPTPHPKPLPIIPTKEVTRLSMPEVDQRRAAQKTAKVLRAQYLRELWEKAKAKTT